MKMRIFLLVSSILYCHSSRAVLEPYYACKAYKNNDLEGANTLLNTVVTHNPDDRSALYNLGKIAYKKGEFETAGAYFAKAAQTPYSSPLLQEQALFDLGNSQAQLKKWSEALQSYESVLALNSEHEPAKKTIEQIKKIMEQEKQKQQEQEKQDKKDQEKEQEKKQNKDQGQQNQDEKNNDQDQNQNDGDKHNNDEKDEQQKDTKDNNDDRHDADQNNQGQQQKQQQDQQQDNRQSKKNDKQQSDEQRDERKEQSEKAAAEKQKEEAVRQQQAQQQAAQKKAAEKQEEKLDYETILLQQAENNDAAMSKMLLQRQVRNETVRHGQKNW